MSEVLRISVLWNPSIDAKGARDMRFARVSPPLPPAASRIARLSPPSLSVDVVSHNREFVHYIPDPDLRMHRGTVD